MERTFIILGKLGNNDKICSVRHSGIHHVVLPLPKSLILETQFPSLKFLVELQERKFYSLVIMGTSL